MFFRAYYRINDLMISVITAYYNSHDFIGKAYDSLKAQSLDSWEWIIVDDGSQAESLVALRAMIEGDERVTVLTQENAGQGAARNLGAKEARGQFLCFLDSDDWFDSRKLEKQIAYVTDNKADLCFTTVEAVRLDDCAENFTGMTGFELKSGRELLPALVKSCLFTLSSVMMTKVCFEELGGFSPQKQFRGTEDYELWLRAAAANKGFACIAEPLTYYHIRYGSEVRDLIRSYDGTLRAIRPLKNDEDSLIRKLACQRSIFLAGRLIMRSIAANQTRIARYWSEEEPRALFGMSKMLLIGDGRAIAMLLNLLYRLKKQI